MPNPNEAELLLLGAVHQRDAASTARLRELVAEEDLDWTWVAENGLRHGVMPLVARNLLAEAEDLLPEELASALGAVREQNRAQVQMLAEELLSLQKELRTQGLEMIPFKGPVLGETLYGELGVRLAGDLDVLVRDGDVERLRAILLGRGYAPMQPLEGAKEDAYRRYYPDFGWWQAEKGICLELHWRLTPHIQAVDFDTRVLWERRREVSFQGERMLSLAPEEYLLFLCVHGSKHLWSRLSWVCDLHEFLRVHPALDWGTCLRMAQSQGSERMLLLGLGLAERMFGTVLPEVVKGRAAADRKAGELVAEMAEAFFAEARPNVFESFEPFLPLRERRWDRFQYYWRHWTTPRVNHLGIVQLPRALWFCYPTIKVFYDYVYRPWLRKPKGSATAGARED